MISDIAMTVFSSTLRGSHHLEWTGSQTGLPAALRRTIGGTAPSSGPTLGGLAVLALVSRGAPGAGSLPNSRLSEPSSTAFVTVAPLVIRQIGDLGGSERRPVTVWPPPSALATVLPGVWTLERAVVDASGLQPSQVRAQSGF